MRKFRLYSAKSRGREERMKTRVYAVGCVILCTAGLSNAQNFHPDIPKAWDDKEVAGFELPLAQRDRSPQYMTSEEYYKLKVRPIYRWYPMYAPGREPAGYLDSLKQKEPEIIFDASKLRTKEDWIAAGKIVFESETQFSPAPAAAPAEIPPGLVLKDVPSCLSSPVTVTTCAGRESWKSAWTPAPIATRAECPTVPFWKVRRALWSSHCRRAR
jgi:hypothetical protein